MELLRVRGLTVYLRGGLECAFPRAFLRVLPIMIALSGTCIVSTVLQSQQIPAKMPQFEAVSIKPTDPDRRGNVVLLPDGYWGENVTPAQLIFSAYGLERHYQIVGLPKWAQSAHYEVMAKVGVADVPAMKPLRSAQRYKMLQPVLEDRFSMRSHWETRSLPAYTLELSGKDSKLKDVHTAGYSKEVQMGGAHIGPGSLGTMNGHLIARGVPIRMLVSVLAGEMDLYVVDGTGLTSEYDFEMQLSPEHSSVAASDAGGLTHSPDQIETTGLIQDGLSQIGLKLVPMKAELPVLVIDELKPPSPN